MTKKKDKGIKREIIGMSLSDYKPPKPKINEKTIKAMETILKDEGLRRMCPSEMESIIQGYKAGKKGK